MIISLIKRIVSEAFKKDPKGDKSRGRWTHNSNIMDGDYFWTWKGELDDYIQNYGRPPKCPNCNQDLNYHRLPRNDQGSFNIWLGNCPWCNYKLKIFQHR